METVEVAIVGAGVMGAATAWALSKRGVDAIVLEQFEPGHDRGSSHGPTRVFRFAYDDPFYVRMAQQSLPLWRQLDPSLLTITGGVDLGVDAEKTFEALRSCGAAAEWLDAAEIRLRYGITAAGDGVFSPDTGVLAASRAVSALLEQSRIPIRLMRAEHIAVKDDSVVLDSSLKARRCILTAGAWTGPLLGSIGIDAPLSVSREQVFYFGGGDGLPVVIDRGKIFRYFVPRAHDAPGGKAGEHGTGERTTADGRSFEIDIEGQARVCDWVSSTFASLDAEPVAAETCLYTNTPDEDFVIDTRGPLIFASPCSGHGFKFAPLIGEMLASMATGGGEPMERFTLRASRGG